MTMSGPNMTTVARNWRDLIRPKGISIDADSSNDFYAKFVCEPLEAASDHRRQPLRRVLLSSLQARHHPIRIDGAARVHRVPDVVEDVGDIILNLKEVVFKAASAKTYTVRVDREGPGPVYARDIQLVDGLTVLNPDHLIAVLDKKGPLAMELTVNVGRGYVPAERNKTPTMPIGTIPIDALFSPIRKVNYVVQNARVGQVTDYDKLTLEVWTNGSVTPADAVAFAAKILKEQLSIWVNFEESEETSYQAWWRRRAAHENLFRSVEELGFRPFGNCCRTRTSRSSASWCSAPSRHVRPRTSAASRSRRSRRSLRTWAELGMKIDNWPQLLERWKAQQAQA